MARKPKASTEEKIAVTAEAVNDCEAELADMKAECEETVRQVKEEYAERTKELKARIRQLKKEQKDLEERKSREELEFLIEKIQSANLSPGEVCERIFGKESV